MKSKWSSVKQNFNHALVAVKT